jgi:hypothetical protein
MMQHLMGAAANHAQLTIPEPRGIVQQQDALDAVLQLAAYIDSQLQAGRVDPDMAANAAAMLMLIREHIQPLPKGLDDDGVTDLVIPDLEEKVGYLRAAADEMDLHG